MKAPITIAAACLTLAAGAGAAEIDFARDVRPILAAHCTKCHGGVHAKAGLSFVRKDSAYAPAKSGNLPIVAGRPDQSELLARVTHSDEDERMPPDAPLEAGQIETLEKWIAAGAEWPQHWAFETWDKDDRAGTSIDQIVASALARAGLKPAPEAPRHTLIRRLSLDLRGLPPTPEEVAAFVGDSSPDAYEKLVDAMLDSPHFGERWARHWLDGARYADSDGYEKDNPRPDAWRWRSWVIDAINADMPFDQFTVEQLAGDLLPGATPEQQLATAFHRQTLFNREGGVDPEEDRTKRTIDRTNTTASVWLGLTMECTQCHDHPYDPLSQREFYGFYGFFNNAEEADAQVPKSGGLMSKELRGRLAAAKARRAGAFETWMRIARDRLRSSTPREWRSPAPSKLDSKAGARFEKQSDGSYLLDGGQPLGTDLYRITLPTEGRLVTGIKLEVLAHPKLSGNGPGRTGSGNFVLSEVRVRAGDKVVSPSSASADFSQKGWPVAAAIDGDRGTGWAVSPQRGKDHHAEFQLPQPVTTGSITVELDQNYAAADGKEGHQIGRFRLSLVSGGPPYPDLPEKLQRALVAEQLRAAEREALADYYFSKIDPETVKLVREGQAGRETGTMKARVMRARERQTFVFHRGDFLQPKKDDGEVTPGFPAILPDTTVVDSRKLNRLDLARWIVSPENPLTARVAANDIWSRLFGVGLVETKADFGTRARPPVQLDLLDHLAGELVRLEWSRKGLIRTIVLSETYRQSSHHRPAAAAVDPDNGLFHRQNRFRVEGEILRDLFLSASGLLKHKIGSPSVFPPIPADVAAQSYASNFKWKTSAGDDRYRRGMYTFFKRTAADPNLITFDCPDANVSVVERNRSNTPIMALATLGNAVFHEAAQALAARVLSDASPADEPARIGRAFLLCTARPPTADEAAAVAKLLRVGRDHYAKDPEAAKTLAGPHLPDGGDPAEVAAWVGAARVLLNLDETQTRE